MDILRTNRYRDVTRYISGRRRGSVLSRVFRAVVERKNFKRYIGVNIIGIALLFSVGSKSTTALDSFYDYDYGYNDESLTTVEYYDEDISTESRFVSPLENGVISQGFSRRHRAVDIKSPVGSNISSVMSGRVVRVRYMSTGYGHHVVIKNGDISVLYAHMDRVFVKSGDIVNSGDVIGTVGVTGFTTGPHLHMEIKQGSEYLNPVDVVSDLD